MSVLITSQQLRLIAPSIKELKSIEIASVLNDVCPKYGINNKNIFEDFLPQLIHESAAFSRFYESMDYQAVALAKKFSRSRISIDDCYRYGRTLKQKANQQMIANTLYGGEWGRINLGNTNKGDGWALRGSGAIQATGFTVINGFCQHVKKTMGKSYTAYQMADLLRIDLKYSVHAACWFFCIFKKLIDEAVADNVLAIRKGVNGGTFGIEEILRLTFLCKKYLK